MIPLEKRFFQRMQAQAPSQSQGLQGSQGPQAVTVFLLNGVKLQGHIIDVDEKTLLLKRENMTQLVFKHAVSTIMPLSPIADL